jgi:NAD(P)-dependent dehydrogenase (short-subunit alcohol dehydrogenase family)
LLSLAKARKKRKTATLAISAVPKGKKIKVLTHQPRYIETAIVPKFGEETSSAAEAEQAAPAARSAEESTIVPKVPIVEPVEVGDGVAKKREFEKNNSAARNSEPTGRSRIAEGCKSSCHNSQEEKNG